MQLKEKAEANKKKPASGAAASQSTAQVVVNNAPAEPLVLSADESWISQMSETALNRDHGPLEHAYVYLKK